MGINVALGSLVVVVAAFAAAVVPASVPVVRLGLVALAVVVFAVVAVDVAAAAMVVVLAYLVLDGFLVGAVALSDLQDHWSQNFLRDRIRPLKLGLYDRDKAVLLSGVFGD
jgi:hypothetical protein